MKLIPVIDLMQGQVVQARRGLRETYRPLQSRLCSGSDPFQVIAGLRQGLDFDTLYVADLDALMGTGDQSELIDRMATEHPDLAFWVDAGKIADGERWTAVLGTESLSGRSWDALKSRHGHWILSLDFFAGDLKGAPEILNQPQCWPERVIVMDLSRVGSLEGPDLNRLQALKERTSHRGLVAAGGVRSREDLVSLAEIGIEAVLVASALHNGALDGAARRNIG